jgi:hypothetical protein
MMPELREALDSMSAIIPHLEEVRRRYASTESEEDREEHDRVQEEAERRRDAVTAVMKRIEDSTGLPPEVWAALTDPNPVGDKVDRRARAALTADEVDPTACLDDNLADALEAVVSRLPSGWLEAEPADLFRLPVEDVGRPVSIVKGFRPESETSAGHRLRQMVQVARDRLAADPRYDHFAGALLVPQLTRLGMRMAMLEGIPGASERIANLWKKPAEVDKTVFELLVAAGLAEMGRKPAFIPESNGKTPDIQCSDPFPMVVECKRRETLSEYELREESLMRELFDRLAAAARLRGMTGVFEIRLNVEAVQLDFQEVVARCVEQRLTLRPSRRRAYGWGDVAFQRRPTRLRLPGQTKAYSPEMLEYAFGWDSDLPQWDGLVCKVDTPEGAVVSEVCGAVAMVWRNDAEVVIEKRSRPPTSLFGKALGQVPPGSFGIVYLCYAEGAREEIADRRLEATLARLKEWEHNANIRVPLVIVPRLYPRALGDGAPDLIESSVLALSEPSGGDPWMCEAYPSCVFTLRQ